MINNFKVDQRETFESARLVDVEPKIGFGSTEQDRDRTGVPKWEITVLVKVTSFGRTVKELVTVGIAAHDDPGAGIPPNSEVELVGLEAGVMANERKDRDTGERRQNGVRVYFRCTGLRAMSAAPFRKIESVS